MLLLIFFIILGFCNITKTNEFHIFKKFEIESLYQGHEGEKRDLHLSIEDVWMSIADFFFKILENERISHDIF